MMPPLHTYWGIGECIPFTDTGVQAKVFHQKKKVILDYALERQNELIKMEYEKSQREKKDLKAENEKLKKELKKKEVAFIK